MNVASKSAVDARRIVPQRLPDSPKIVENSAAPKASTSPMMASRNRTQTCDSASCGRRDAAAGGLVEVRSEIILPIRRYSGPWRCFHEHMTWEGRVEVTEETESRSRTGKQSCRRFTQLV